MDTLDFFIIFIPCALLILAFRVCPMFMLKDRQLPENFIRALNFIPAAAFAALVANDLFKPELFTTGQPWDWMAPLIAAVMVLILGIKTKSMAWCTGMGVVFLAVLTYLPQLF